MYDNTHYNIVISLQLIKINEKKNIVLKDIIQWHKDTGHFMNVSTYLSSGGGVCVSRGFSGQIFCIYCFLSSDLISYGGGLSWLPTYIIRITMYLVSLKFFIALITNWCIYTY